MHNNHKMGSSDSLLKTIREIMEKKHTTPETPKEKSLAKLAHPKDKITHKDVLVGRGVLKKENSGDRMGVIVGTRKEKVELDPKLKEEEQVDERKLTGTETEKKEKYVMSLKGKMGGFKKRYGERAKEVMYATATKMAKEELNIDEASSEFKATGRKHPDGSITVRVERDGRTQVHTGKPAYVHKQIMDRYKIPSTSINMKEASDEQIGEMSGQYNESKTLGKYSFSGSLGKYGYSGKSSKSDSKSEPEKTYVFKPDGKVELPKKSKQVDELDRQAGSVINRYISKTTDDPKRKEGRNLALKKKWGDKNYGLPEPKVKAVTREEVEQVDELSSKTLSSYKRKSGVQLKKNGQRQDDDEEDFDSLDRKTQDTVFKRMRGDNLLHAKAKRNTIAKKLGYKGHSDLMTKGKSGEKALAISRYKKD